jgi:hypothetical protein
MGRSVEDEGEEHEGDGIFVPLSNSDGDMAGENAGLDAWKGISGVERLVDECLSGQFEEE